MKFTKFGKALLLSALSAGVVFGLTSCNQTYTVGYLFVTGTYQAGTAQSVGSGYVNGFAIDHNTGNLTALRGPVVSSGGSNPVRAVLAANSRFLYVLNQGASADGAACSATDICQNANVTGFLIGGSGVLTPLGQSFFSQGLNPIRMVLDNSGNYLMVLDHDAPDNTQCAKALNGATACGDITVFQILSTGQLSLVMNTSLSSANGAHLTYFPVPANPIDFVMGSSVVFTIAGAPGTSQVYFPYGYNSTNGQLSITANSVQPLTNGSASGSVKQATAIVAGNGLIYVLDNEPPTPSTGAVSQILQYSPSGNLLNPKNGGLFANDTSLADPVALLVESTNKFLYVANNSSNPSNLSAALPNGGISAFTIDPTSSILKLNSGEPYGVGSGPKCIVEDPSNQFIYEADSTDQQVYGREVDPISGSLNALRAKGSYALSGPATWCMMDARTN